MVPLVVGDGKLTMSQNGILNMLEIHSEVSSSTTTGSCGLFLQIEISDFVLNYTA